MSDFFFFLLWTGSNRGHWFMNPARCSPHGKIEGRNGPEFICVHLYEFLASTGSAHAYFCGCIRPTQSRDQFLSSLYLGILKFVGVSKPLLSEMSASELRVPKRSAESGWARPPGRMGLGSSATLTMFSKPGVRLPDSVSATLHLGVAKERKKGY